MEEEKPNLEDNNMLIEKRTEQITDFLKQKTKWVFYIILGLIVFYYRIFTGGYSIGTVILTALLLIMGLQSLIFAMLFDMESNKNLFG